MRLAIRKSLVSVPLAALCLGISAALVAAPATSGDNADNKMEAGEDQVAQAEEHQRRCLSLNQIRRIEIIDDQTLKFHMRGSGPDYLNHLPYRCSGLKSRGAFMHATSTSDYCDLDIITQIDTSIGMRLGSCPLGKFEAVARE